ncbi:MAG: TIGR01440 family protein [Peptococcaceae bacterium]|nr:TIGR01440 family protein [Peptococcaceae bacterium]
MFEIDHIASELETILKEMVERQTPQDDDIFVIGCSTSEVCGKRIGKAGSPDVAAVLFPVLRRFAQEHNLHLAFQCCEHLNRSLVVERETMRRFGLTEVCAVPHVHAGGSMASHAYRQFTNPVLVEGIKAGYGLDIGETMIGMHMRPVAVPMRLAHRSIGDARANPSFSRPRLIGGIRARYTVEDGDHFGEEQH